MHDDASLPVLRSFVKFDVVAASLAVVGVGTTAVLLASPRLLGATAAVGCLALLLISVRGPLEDGRITAAIVRVSVGNWIVAIGVSVALPFLWPTMVLTALLPLVLAAPHLDRRGLERMLAVTAVFTAAVAIIGVATEAGGVVGDLADWFKTVALVTTVVGLIVPIGVIVAQNNGLQRTALDRARVLNVRLDESAHDLTSSRRRVVEAADRERIRIERDLHDGAQQRLVALGLRLRLLQSKPLHPELADTVASLVNEVDLTIDELRDLAQGIYPPMLEARGLSGAFAAVVRRSAQHVDTDLGVVDRFDPAIETAVYFAGMEALTNAAKHAPNAACRIGLEQSDGSVRLTVADQGEGFHEPLHRRGLLNMTDRVAAVGGTCDVESLPGTGTTIRIAVPTSSTHLPIAGAVV